MSEEHDVGVVSQTVERRASPGGWPAWAATWASILVSTLVAVVVLAQLSSNVARTSLEIALGDHLRAQSRLIAAELSDFPVELLAGFGGDRVTDTLRETLRELADAGGLHSVAVMGPDTIVLMDPEAERWIPAQAEMVLILDALRGESQVGALYRDQLGDLYLTAYVPIPKHPGWLVATEGSGATLGSVDDLERQQLLAGVIVVLLAGLFGALLSRLLVRPILRLDKQLVAVRPGDHPDVVDLYGPREVRGVALAARELLSAIRLRDGSISEAHRREVEQITRMAAEVAHEVRNPLNAISLSVDRLQMSRDEARRTKVATRIRDQIDQLEAIVKRLVNVARPLTPTLASCDLVQLVGSVVEEMGPQGVEVDFESPETLQLVSDGVMIVEVVRNLCLNAQQAGATNVQISIEVQGRQAVVCVSDDGPGIPEDRKEEIFSWFHTTRAEGSGLGLPTSRRMISALRGRLELAKAYPATFEVGLPLGGTDVFAQIRVGESV